MIIALRTEHYAEVIDRIVQFYAASYPVCNAEQEVIGSVWLTDEPGRVSSLVVLDRVEHGYLELWSARDKHVLFAEPMPLTTQVEVLVVHDKRDSVWACSSLFGETVDDMAGILEEAFLG